MSKMTIPFFILALAALFVTCGSRAFRARVVQNDVGAAVYPFAVSSARQRVMPHLHYAVDIYHKDKKGEAVELSFFFVKEQGDSLLWVECVEMVPLSLIDTVMCRRWYSSDCIR